MTALAADTCRAVGEAAWRWVLDQVRWDEGPWVPTSVPVGPPDPESSDATPPWDRDGVHSGVGGLALALAEVRLCRPWTPEEHDLAEAVAARLRDRIAVAEDCTFFDGLAGSVGVLGVLGASGAEASIERLSALARTDGWPQTVMAPPKYPPGSRLNDLTLGTGGVLLAAVWALRARVRGAAELAGRAADVLMAEAEPTPAGLNWLFTPRRFRPEQAEMPNFSHGLAGIGAALACAGTELDRPDLVEAAALAAEHLVTLRDPAYEGFVVPRSIPRDTSGKNLDDVTYNWCHGPAGTSLLFVALDRAGVDEVAGRPPTAWHEECLAAVRASGIPHRKYPGFWDNDGRCCGTAGVGDVLVDAWHRTGDERHLELADRLASSILDRVVLDGPHASWRFVEHREADPLLPPGVGWMQGAAGIAAFLLHLGRAISEGPDAAAVARPDNWWAVV